MLRGISSLRWWTLGLVMLGTAALTGCQGQIVLDVDVAEDGSGTVRVDVEADAEAADQLVLDLTGGSSLPLSDLAEAGWDVSPPVRQVDGCRVVDNGGCLVISAAKNFGSPEQFSDVMAEVSGDGGIFQDFQLVRTQSFGRIDYNLTGFVETTDQFDVFGDDELSTALGRGVNSILTSEPYVAQSEDVAIVIEVGLPGEIQEDSSNGDDSDDDPERTTAEWTTDLSTPRLDVALFTARRSSTAQVLRGAAVVAAVLAALLVFGQVLLSLGPLRRERPEAETKLRPADAHGRTADEIRAEEEAAQAAAEAAEAADGCSVVALDGPGVLYRVGADVDEMLIPFLREHGSRIPDRDVVEKARLLSLGRITTPDFWLMMGLPGDPEELDAAYVARHQLTSGVVRYLRALRNNNVRVACVTNEAAAWARRLRAGHSLDGLIDTWVVSGSVGVRKPDEAIFEVLRRTTGVPASAIMFIDDDLDNLDAARSMGMSTRWFTADGVETLSRGHSIQRNFESATEQMLEQLASDDGQPSGRLTDTGSVPVVAIEPTVKPGPAAGVPVVQPSVGGEPVEVVGPEPDQSDRPGPSSDDPSPLSGGANPLPDEPSRSGAPGPSDGAGASGNPDPAAGSEPSPPAAPDGR